MIRQDSKIAFTTDVVDQVAKELKISKEKVEHVYEAMMKYLKYLTLETNVVAIFIPSLGTLHIKMKHILDRIKFFKDKPDKQQQLSIFESKKERINKYVEKIKDHPKFVTLRHFEYSLVNKIFYNNGKTIEEIEKFQNSK